MSPSTNLIPRNLVQQMLVDRAGPSPDAAALSAATAQVYDQAAQELNPLIGEHGVNALAERSLHLMRREFTWLTAKDVLTPEVSPIAQLRLDLERQAPPVALAAGAALIATFTELLSTFLGARLTKHLLGQAWPGGPTDEPMERST
jgi:hypothetical protein